MVVNLALVSLLVTICLGANFTIPIDKRVAAPKCSFVVLPRSLCSRCPLLPYSRTGNFARAQQIYDIDDPGCLAGIRKYSQMNPCDKVRRKQLKNMKDPMMRDRIGVFMYSVCETCCDCIPRGARSNQFRRRKRSGWTLLTEVNRGNCPAHAVYDLCRVWPNIRSVVRPGLKPNLDWEEVCPWLRSWLVGPDSRGWLTNGNADMDWRIRRFLTQFNANAKCRKQKTWKACAKMELAQERI